MGRALRFTYAGAMHHVAMRCNNKEFLFDPPSFQLFLDGLGESCDKFDVQLHNYCLMTNHVHLLFTVPTDDVLSKFMHRVANGFAKRFNTIRGRKGHLWEGRFRSALVEASSCFFRSMAYIDLNPVRARIVERPTDYPWQAHSALIAEDESLITFHKMYLDLGRDPAARHQAYFRLIEAEAGRPAHSLAAALFVGGDHFVWRMQKRFGVMKGKAPLVERVDLGDGIRSIELSKSRKPKVD
jgi:REP-associated tyrosine transposase